MTYKYIFFIMLVCIKSSLACIDPIKKIKDGEFEKLNFMKNLLGITGKKKFTLSEESVLKSQALGSMYKKLKKRPELVEFLKSQNDVSFNNETFWQDASKQIRQAPKALQATDKVKSASKTLQEAYKQAGPAPEILFIIFQKHIQVPSTNKELEEYLVELHKIFKYGWKPYVINSINETIKNPKKPASKAKL